MLKSYQHNLELLSLCITTSLIKDFNKVNLKYIVPPSANFLYLVPLGAKRSKLLLELRTSH